MQKLTKGSVIFQLLLLVFFCNQANAQNRNFRKYGNEFLTIGADARGLAMGGSVLGTTQSSSASYWNPSLLSLQDYHLGISAMYAEYLGGISKYNYMSIARKLGNGRSAIGFSLVRLSTDNIPNTLQLIGDDGSINYSNVTQFDYSEYGYLFAFSRNLSKDTNNFNTAFGGNLKLISKSAKGFAKAWGIGLDLSFTAKNENTSIAVALKDATSTVLNWNFNLTEDQKIIFQQTNNDIPIKGSEFFRPVLMFDYGQKFRFKDNLSLLLETNLITYFESHAGSITNSDNLTFSPNFGAELNYNDKVMLRGGISNFQKQTKTNGKYATTFTPGLGLGLVLGNIGIDYAFTKFSNESKSPFSHFISLSANIAKKVVAEDTPIEPETIPE